MTRVAFAALAASILTTARAADPAAAGAAPAANAPASAAGTAPLPPAALTAGSDGGWSVGARVGTYVPVIGQYNVNRPGFSFEAGVGRRLVSWLHLEVSGFLTKVDTNIPVADSGPYEAGIATMSETDIAGVLATARATWASGPVELFAGGGTGYYWVEQYKQATSPTTIGGFLSHDHPWGLHALAGTSVRITPAMHLAGEVRYTYLEPRLNGRYERVDGIGIALAAGFRF